MSKGLEALDKIINFVDGYIYYAESLDKEYETIEKELKALEIIKSIKGLIEKEDLFYDNEENNYYFFGNKITQEEYDLLKEVLL